MDETSAVLQKVKPYLGWELVSNLFCPKSRDFHSSCSIPLVLLFDFALIYYH